MIVQIAWIHRFKTARGGWTRAQVEAIGLRWPPKKGWQRRMAGRVISEEQRRRFEDGRTQFIPWTPPSDGPIEPVYQSVTQDELWEMRCGRCETLLSNPFFWTPERRAAYRLLCPRCHDVYMAARPCWSAPLKNSSK